MRGELFSPQQIEVLDRLFDRQQPCPIQSSSDLYLSPDSGKVRAWHHAGSGQTSTRLWVALMTNNAGENFPLKTNEQDGQGQTQSQGVASGSRGHQRL